MEVPTANTQAHVAPEPPKQAPKQQAPASSRVPSIIVALVVVAVAGLSIWYLLRGEPLLVQGEADATRLDIAARVDGRVAEIPVERGQDVAAGAVLVKIDNPETLAKNEQTLAAKIVAEAQLANVNIGTRAEVIAARKAELERAAATSSAKARDVSDLSASTTTTPSSRITGWLNTAASTAKANSGTPKIKISAARSCSSHRHSRRATSRNPGFGFRLMREALSARPPIQVGAHAGAELRHLVDRVGADRERAQIEVAGGAGSAPARIFAFGGDQFDLDGDAAVGERSAPAMPLAPSMCRPTSSAT
jgi:multidrug efflux pump subunit AcrA (membrane-fusion protein)